MAGLFADGKILSAKVWTDFIPEFDLQVGRIIILRKKLPPSTRHFCQDELTLQLRSDEENSSTAGYTLIIHRIVGKFCLKDQLFLWEKGDNDYFPKACYPDEIAAIVVGIEGQSELSPKLQPGLWQKRNQKLLKFYKMAGMIYALIEKDRGKQKGRKSQRQDFFSKAFRKGFWCTFHFLCSFFNLKGN